MMLLIFQVILHIVTYLKCALQYDYFQFIANLIHSPWPRWQYEIIAWTNVDFSLLRFCGIHLKTVSQWMPKLLLRRMRPKLNCWNYCRVSKGQWVKENAWLLCPTILFCWSLISYILLSDCRTLCDDFSTVYSNLISQCQGDSIPFFHWLSRRFDWNLRLAIFKLILIINGWGIYCEIVLMWMSLDLTEDKSNWVQVMAWCCQATSHYLNPMLTTRPQWIYKTLDSFCTSPSFYLYTHIKIIWPCVKSSHYHCPVYMKNV